MRAKGEKLRIIERRVLKMGAGENQVLKKTREAVKGQREAGGPPLAYFAEVIPR